MESNIEIWDAYNKDFEILGYNLIRGRSIPQGVFHIVSNIIIKHSDGDYLLMQRSNDKVNFPGKFEATASGCALKGESAIECAIRELKEETGISISSPQFIKRWINQENHGLYYMFFSEVKCNKDSIRLQQGETIGYKWVSIDQLLQIIESNTYIDLGKKYIKQFLIQKI